MMQYEAQYNTYIIRINLSKKFFKITVGMLLHLPFIFVVLRHDGRPWDFAEICF